MSISTNFFVGAFIVFSFFGAVFQTEAERVIPHPLPAHSGNIFIAGETVVIPAPPGESKNWRAVDYEGKVVAEGKVKDGKADLGKLPVGYYEVSGDSQQAGRITVGVISPLRAPTPMDSPIGIDVAMAWSYPVEKMADAANLCALAGMNRVRDRLLWGEIEPQPGQYVVKTRYEASLDIQINAGLQVLQVNHLSPQWANTNVKRMPLDLRDAYNFYRELARRWRGRMVAFEPWNEAEIKEFGGHTGNEMASLQKASYLGLKAGNPDLTVCENVFAIHRQTTLRNFNDNQPWPYFEVYNLHHYEPLANFPKIYADHRAVSAGRPMWVSECSVTVEWGGDENLKEPNAENLHVQSERIAKIYAESIHEGTKAMFYFMLPHYTERKIQYGLLHPDMTPRPGYVALAAVGRLLAGAKPLGSLDAKDTFLHGYLFGAKPDGKDAEVLVVWYDGEGGFELPKPPQACFDFLGRAVEVKDRKLKLKSQPLFAVLSKDSRPPLVAPPQAPPRLDGKPSPVVMQALMPEESIELVRSGYKLDASGTNSVPIFIYNFGATAVQGQLHFTIPKDWTMDCPGKVELAPGERRELSLKLGPPKTWEKAARVGIKGDFGAAGEVVLALRFFSPTE